jgi:ribonuclease Z
MNVTAAPLQHSVPCVGYVVKELPKAGTLRVDKVQSLVDAQRHQLKQALGLSDGYRVFRILKELKPEETFTFPDGTVVKGSDIVEPEQVGRKIVILGDTCNNDMIADIAQVTSLSDWQCNAT